MLEICHDSEKGNSFNKRETSGVRDYETFLLFSGWTQRT